MPPAGKHHTVAHLGVHGAPRPRHVCLRLEYGCSIIMELFAVRATDERPTQRGRNVGLLGSDFG
jgi:hypothetical protein